jgi:hypothetical protein
MKDFEVFALTTSLVAFTASSGVALLFSFLHSQIEKQTVAWMKGQEEINRSLRERIELLEQLGTHLTNSVTGRTK